MIIMLKQQYNTIQLDNKLLDGEVDMMALHNHCFQKGEVYVQCQRRGYTRSYGAMKKMIKKLQLTEKKEKRTYPKSKWIKIPTTYPREKAQIDIKYIPQHCIGWDSKGIKYYQITAIDEFSRKRVYKVVDEKSVTHTAAFLDNLEEKFGFSIKTVQTDNGREFTNDPKVTTKKNDFRTKIRRKRH